MLRAMRSVLVMIAALVGCTGEHVLSPIADTGVDSSTAADTRVDDTQPVGDTQVSDAADVAMSDTPDAGCPKYDPEYIPDGDFSTGIATWRATDCTVSEAAGPCGKALHVQSSAIQTRVQVDYSSAPIPLGTKLHLRGWFKKGTAATNPPSVIIRSYGPDGDGGETYDDYKLFTTATDTWTLFEVVFTLKNQQTGMQVLVDTYAEGGVTRDYMVGHLSLTKEP
jgi:hypothetical protein